MKIQSRQMGKLSNLQWHWQQWICPELQVIDVESTSLQIAMWQHFKKYTMLVFKVLNRSIMENFVFTHPIKNSVSEWQPLIVGGMNEIPERGSIIR